MINFRQLNQCEQIYYYEFVFTESSEKKRFSKKHFQGVSKNEKPLIF